MLLAHPVDKVSLHDGIHIADKEEYVFLFPGHCLQPQESGFVLEIPVLLLQVPDLREQVPYAVADLVLAPVCEVRDLFDPLLPLLHKRQSSSAACDEQTHSAVIAQDLHYFDQADLTGPSHMGRAAGADVNIRDCDEAGLPFNLDLAPVVYLPQFFIGRIRYFDGKITVYDLIGFPLEEHDIFLVQLSVDIERHGVVAEMKADVVKSVHSVHQPGQDVLARMVLHEAESSLPVDLKAHRFVDPERQRRVRAAAHNMADFAVPDLHVGHRQHLFPHVMAVQGTDPADVRRLSARFREKYCPVRDYFIQYGRRFPSTPLVEGFNPPYAHDCSGT